MTRLRHLLWLLAATLGAQTYDTVIVGGRVMDPASNLDAVRNIGISGGRIAAITPSPIGFVLSCVLTTDPPSEFPPARRLTRLDVQKCADDLRMS